MLHQDFAFSAGGHHRGDFPCKGTGPNRGLGAGGGFDCVGILILSRKTVGLGALFSECPHGTALIEIGIFQPVEGHMVEDLSVTKAETPSRFRDEVGSVSHGLHAARDNHFVAVGHQ